MFLVGALGFSSKFGGFFTIFISSDVFVSFRFWSVVGLVDKFLKIFTEILVEKIIVF